MEPELLTVTLAGAGGPPQPYDSSTRPTDVPAAPGSGWLPSITISVTVHEVPTGRSPEV